MIICVLLIVELLSPLSHHCPTALCDFLDPKLCCELCSHTEAVPCSLWSCTECDSAQRIAVMTLTAFCGFLAEAEDSGAHQGLPEAV